MKIKALKFISKDDIGTFIDIAKDEIIALDDEVATKLIKEKKAEILF
jgi:hypothetical protein